MGSFAISLGVVSGICFATGLAHLFFGLRRQGTDMKHLTFGLFALGYSGSVLGGLLMYQAASLSQYVFMDRWSGMLVALTFIFLIWFVTIYTEVVSWWFPMLLTALFAVVATAHVTRPTLVYAEIAGIVPFTLPWGEQITVLEAADSAWFTLFLVGQLLTIGFVLYACLRQYRSGERGAALLLAGGMLLFVGVIIFDVLVDSGVIDFILLSDFGFLPLAIMMSLRVSNSIIRTEEELGRYQRHLEGMVEERTAALRRSERTARALIDAPPDSAFLLDPRGVILDLNEVAAVRLGVSRDKVIGRDTFELFGPEVGAARRARLEEAVATQSPVRWQDRRADYVFDNTFYPILDNQGQVTSVAAFAVDITERVQAQQALRQRVEELVVLNRVTKMLAGTQDLEGALGQVSELLANLFQACYVHVVLLRENEADLDLDLLMGFERGVGPISATRVAVSLDEIAYVRRVISGLETVVLTDVPTSALSTPLRESLPTHNVESVLLVPLVARGRASGLLSVAADQAGRVFTENQVRLAETFAGDIGAAIENVRLFEQAQAAAISEERSRIARDLHDSVTQSIYSASLIAEALPRVWERDPELLEERLRALPQIIQGVLAEMRTLLFELRPASLEEASLNSLLEQLGSVLTGRTRIPVETTIQGRDNLPSEVKTGLYRIAQEAFNNVAKHAGASQVWATLQNGPASVALSIRDDGRGFDPDGVPVESMGIRIMRERADEIGADLAVKSAPGRGTEVTVAWKADEGG